jgi:hypothetical protein
VGGRGKRHLVGDFLMFLRAKIARLFLLGRAYLIPGDGWHKSSVRTKRRLVPTHSWCHEPFGAMNPIGAMNPLVP